MPDELSDDAKRFIVSRLACFDTPSEVVKAVKEDLGIDVTRQRVHAYDPGTSAGRRLSGEFKLLHQLAREEYLANQAAIGIASKVHRLRMLDRVVATAMKSGNLMMAMQALEQAAKECGGAFTNEHKIKHAGSIAVRDDDAASLTDEELERIARGAGRAAPPH